MYQSHPTKETMMKDYKHLTDQRKRRILLWNAIGDFLTALACIAALAYIIGKVLS
jgi:hypothetical protein